MATEAVLPRIKPKAEEPSAVKLLTVRQLMWLRFTRSRPAVYSGLFLILLYLSALFAQFIAPYGVRTTHAEYVGARPNSFHFWDANGQFHGHPFVYGMQPSVDPKTFTKIYKPITDKLYPVRFWAKGEPYKLWGLIPTERHLFQVDAPAKIFVLGTDSQGRDLFSRIFFGAQVSLTVGLIGVLLSLVIGSFAGIVGGYYGGVVDNILQRAIEVLLAFPQIPLWLALAAALPPNWSSITVYFGITIVLSIVNWGGLARQMRAKVLALRDRDYVVAARYANCSDMRIITRHLFPNTISHVVVIATLSIPNMILGETALSFLGLGIRPPMTSWGVLLSEAQHVRVLLQQPWLITPALFVIATVIAFNFLGDGLRDAADPFAE
ncbi:MAG: ABC transporter permease [Caldilineaceae bacterium]